MKLIKHVRRHAREKPHYCHACGKMFGQTHGQQTHTEIHCLQRVKRAKIYKDLQIQKVKKIGHVVKLIRVIVGLRSACVKSNTSTGKKFDPPKVPIVGVTVFFTRHW